MIAPVRTLGLLRHATAAWLPGEGADADRPLTNRGHAEAEQLGHWLRSSRWKLDLVLCSAAVRTVQTWQAVQRGWACQPQLAVEPALYAAPAELLLQAVRELACQASAVLVVAHNPGVHQLAYGLTADGAEPAVDQQVLDRLSTDFAPAALAEFACDGDWPDLSPASVRLTRFTTPAFRRGTPPG